MTDRELLELAVKAAGYWSAEFNCPCNSPRPEWNPLTDDGDALRLAVKLNMRVDTYYPAGTKVEVGEISLMLPHHDDPYAATRRAIVRAAAEIGKEME